MHAAEGPAHHVEPDLFLHDVDLVGDRLVGDDRAAHPVGLEEQHQLERARRHDLEVVGVVGRGAAVELPAVALNQLGVLELRQVLRAFEHQVFEEMRETGAALGFGPEADVVVHGDGDDRGAAVGRHHDAETVAQRVAFDRETTAKARVDSRSET